MFSSHACQRNLLKKSLINKDAAIFTHLTMKSSFSSSPKPLAPVQAVIEKKTSEVFFSKPAQILMKKITGLNLDKINRFRTMPGELKAPLYKFMTTEMLQKARKAAIRNSLAKLQMPPMLPVNKNETEVIDNTPEIIGFTKAKHVFTDITYNVSDRKRLVVVREPDGVLRKAKTFEKHRMNQLYFPKPGREYQHPRMFQKENLEPLWEKGEFEFILNRACVQFEPDDQEFHDIVFETYERINNEKAFEVLRSTRHCGPFVFYLCLSKNLNNLLKENLETNKLNDAVSTIKLYTLIHPDCEFKKSEVHPKNGLKFIQSFVKTEMVNTETLNTLLENLLTQASKDVEPKEPQPEQPKTE